MHAKRHRQPPTCTCVLLLCVCCPPPAARCPQALGEAAAVLLAHLLAQRGPLLAPLLPQQPLTQALLQLLVHGDAACQAVCCACLAQLVTALHAGCGSPVHAAGAAEAGLKLGLALLEVRRRREPEHECVGVRMRVWLRACVRVCAHVGQ